MKQSGLRTASERHPDLMPATAQMPVQLRQQAEHFLLYTPGGRQGREHGDGFPIAGLVMSIKDTRTGGKRSGEKSRTKSTDFHHQDHDSGYRWKGTGETGAKRTVSPAPPEDEQGGEDEHGVGVRGSVQQYQNS